MPRTVYVIQQTNWRYTDEFFVPDSDSPVKAFTSLAAAESYRQELEAEARREIEAISPLEKSWWTSNLAATFSIGNLERITSLNEAEIRERLKALGLPFFPDATGYDKKRHVKYWDEAWWERAWQRLGSEGADGLWNMFDKLRFFEVVEVELEEQP
jgi:hypothetical protein